MYNSYFERLNKFKSEINSTSALAKELKRNYKELQRIHGKTGKGSDWSKMIHVLWDLEKNTQLTNAILENLKMLRDEAIDYWSSRKLYNETNYTRE